MNALSGVRVLMGYLPKVGLVSKPVQRPEGLSFVVPVMDEPRWIGPCLRSILDVADEIIVVDGSVKPETPEIISELATKTAKITHIRFVCGGPHSFALSCHVGLVNAVFRWVFKWDSDFVADPEKLAVWKRRLAGLDRDRYFVVDLPRVNLMGDLQHQPGYCPFGVFEARVFTWSRELRWSLKDDYWEQVCGDSVWGHRFPPWFRILRWSEPYVFHCDIKSDERMLMRRFWMDYMRVRGGRFSSLRDYTEFRVMKDWGLTMKEASEKVRLENSAKLVSYDHKRFGDLPGVLQ